MPNMLEVKVNNGKYTVIQDENGILFALRYGEPWREYVGDNLIHALACELQEARDKLHEIDLLTEGYVDGSPDASKISNLCTAINQIIKRD